MHGGEDDPSWLEAGPEQVEGERIEIENARRVVGGEVTIGHGAVVDPVAHIEEVALVDGVDPVAAGPGVGHEDAEHEERDADRLAFAESRSDGSIVASGILLTAWREDGRSGFSPERKVQTA